MNKTLFMNGQYLKTLFMTLRLFKTVQDSIYEWPYYNKLTLLMNRSSI